jgi:HEAT repeat protein
LLANENSEDALTDGASEQESEEQSEYYARLIGTVAGLRDERAIPALLGAAPTGAMAIQGVARFGKKALDGVLGQVKSHDSELASAAVTVLANMLEFRTVSDPDSHLRIKNALRSALASPDSGLRDSAVFAVEFLDDREEFVPMLKELAEHDPSKLEGQPLYDGTIGDFYYVRTHAKRALRSIANHEPPAVDKRGLQY